MRILWGINGTGNGHIVKSNTIINQLKNRGHDVDILISGTNHQIKLENVAYNFKGLSFQYSKSGGIDYLKTIKDLSPIRLIKDLRLDVKSYDRVVTDFEPITAWACKLQNKKSIGVSHQYAFLSPLTPRPDSGDWIGEFVLNKLAPVTKPIGLHFRKYDDFILPPVLRDDIFGWSENLNHYTVYLPSFDIKLLVHFFSKFPYQFHIFGKVDKPIVVENIHLYPNSGDKFKESFLSASGIITSAGFETPSEALYLQKKLAVIPIRGQFEQLSNAEALRRMGVFVASDLESISDFFNQDKRPDFSWYNPIPKIIEEILM